MKIKLTCVALWLAISGAASAAELYPQKPITIVVPFAAGSSSDLAARIYAKALSEDVKQTVLVDNRPGANARIGAQMGARAAPDGYTLFFGSGTANAVNYALYAKSITYKPEDFTTISLIQSNPVVMFAATSGQTRVLNDVLSSIKSSGKAACGSGNAVGQVACTMFGIRIRAQSQLVGVPYKSTAAALTDLGGGRLDVAFTDIGVGATFIANGLVVPIAVATQQRLEAFPLVPTFEELGLSDFRFASWTALFAPAGTPQPIVERLNRVARELLATPEWQQRRKSVSGVPVSGDLAESRKFVASEIARWASYIKDAGVKVE